jgi:DNA-binding NarL/FixJ family response regulator
MIERIAIVSADASYGDWLRHYIGTFHPYADISNLPLTSLTAAELPAEGSPFHIVLLHTAFAEDGAVENCEGLRLLQQLRRASDAADVIVLAEQGDEISATESMRHGAADYLPRHRVTPERLSRALRRSRHLREQRAAAARRGSGPEALSQTMPIDIVIPRYEILRTLGSSEHANVYLASAQDREEHVALKVTELAAPDDLGTHELLAREYQAIAALDHPAVVDIYDYGVHAGREYLAMEYFSRGDLRNRMCDPLSVAAALAYAARIAGALEVVHGAGLVHRDLKPQNVMLRENDEVVLIDFGLAKNISNATHSTRAGTLRGSPYFMSPEQAQGEVVDARSDIYSLGVIFFEMLMHRKPFHGKTAIDVLQQHVSAPLPQLPEQLACFQPLLERLLAKDRNHRFANAAELRGALAAA